MGKGNGLINEKHAIAHIMNTDEKESKQNFEQKGMQANGGGYRTYQYYFLASQADLC